MAKLTVLVPVVPPERVTISEVLPLEALAEAEDAMERVAACGATVTVTVPVALLTVVPPDGLDSITEKARSLVCEALFRIGTVIVLDVSLAANESVPEVAV